MVQKDGASLRGPGCWTRESTRHYPRVLPEAKQGRRCDSPTMITSGGPPVTNSSRCPRRALASWLAADRVELAQRSSSHLIVSLLWNRDTGELSVAVVDPGGGVFDLVLASEECPLEAFYHPYAYAAFRSPSPDEKSQFTRSASDEP